MGLSCNTGVKAMLFILFQDLPEENRSEVISITNKIRMHSHTLRFTCKSYTVGEKALSLKVRILWPIDRRQQL